MAEDKVIDVLQRVWHEEAPLQPLLDMDYFPSFRIRESGVRSNWKITHLPVWQLDHHPNCWWVWSLRLSRNLTCKVNLLLLDQGNPGNVFKGQVMKTDPNDQDKWAMQHITYPVLPPSSSSWPSPPRAALSPPPPDIQFILWWYNYICTIASFYRFSNKLQTNTLSLNFFAS